MNKVPVKNYEGIYEIDENGVIFSKMRFYTNSLGRRYKIKGCVRKPIDHCTGYQTITLCKDKYCRTLRYHRVVAESLIENPDNKPFVNHIDGNKRNNHPSNLEWVTEKENSEHAISTGLFDVRGVNNPACRFSFEDVVDWYVLKTQGVLIKDIASAYGCGRDTISRLINIEIFERL